MAAAAAASGLALNKAVHVALLCMILAAPSFLHVAQAQQITCSVVVNNLSPCVSYLLNGGNLAPNSPCCGGVHTLFGKAKTTPNRQAICTCIKNALDNVSYDPKNLQYAKALPKKCGVQIPYKIDPSTDCKTIR